MNFLSASEFMAQFRSYPFSRIVPNVKAIGLWGPRIQAAYKDMGVIGYADVDVVELFQNDENVAEEFDDRMRDIQATAAAGEAD